MTSLLLLDEVVTGFRLGFGGGMEYFGVSGDLATYGKALAGGLPIGALSGRAEVMDLLGKPWGDPKGVFMGGTFSGNPLTMAGGVATLDHMKENQATLFPYLNEQGDRLADAVNTFCEERQMGATLMNAGSIFYMHFKRGGIASSRDLADENHEAEHEFYVHLLDKGVIVPGIHLFFTSAAHTPQHIDQIATAFQDALLAVREDGSDLIFIQRFCRIGGWGNAGGTAKPGHGNSGFQRFPRRPTPLPSTKNNRFCRTSLALTASGQARSRSSTACSPAATPWR